MRWQALLADIGYANLARALVLSLPLLALVLCGPWWERQPLGPVLGWYPVPVAFAVIVQLGWGRAGLMRALAGLARGRFGADLLVHTGAAAALALACWAAWLVAMRSGPVPEAGMLLAVWRDSAFGASLVALHLIAGMTVLAGDSGGQIRPASGPGTGDGRHEVEVPPGAPVPFDGRVTRGTGEVQDPLGSAGVFPVMAGPGSELHAGTRNGDGTLWVLPLEPPLAGPDTNPSTDPVTHVSAESDRVARIMMCCAAIAVCWQVLRAPPGANLPAMILLLVAEAAPLSLVLAAVAPFSELLRLCRRLGIRITDFSALGRLRAVRSVVFGSHGVLTPDRMRVLSLQTADGVEPREVINRAASVAQLGHDPWGVAVLDFAVGLRLRLQPAEGYSCAAGNGTMAMVAGKATIIGTRAFLEASGVDCMGLDAAAAAAGSQGRQLRWVADLSRAPRLLGFIIFGSPPVAGAAVAIKNLERLGFATAWCTRGDGSSSATLAKGLKIVGLPSDDTDGLGRWRMRQGPLMVVASGLSPGSAGAGDVLVRFGARAIARQQDAAFTIARQDPGIVVDLIGIAARYRRMLGLNGILVVATTLVALALPPASVFDLANAGYEIAVALFILVSALGLRAQALTANEVDEE